MDIFSFVDICTKFDNLCSQLCEPTEDSYACKCNDGFTLAEDNRNCLPIDGGNSTTVTTDVSTTPSDQ